MQPIEVVATLGMAALFLLAWIVPLAAMLKRLGWPHSTLIALLAVAAFVASLVLQFTIGETESYVQLMTALARVGRVILAVAVCVLVAALTVLVATTALRGKRDDWKSDVDAGNRGAFFQAPGAPLLMKRSVVETLYSAGSYVPMESLLGGSATTNDRVMFVGIFAVLTAFCFVFIGASLMLMGRILFAAVLPLGAAHILYRNARIAIGEYRTAKRGGRDSGRTHA